MCYGGMVVWDPLWHADASRQADALVKQVKVEVVSDERGHNYA